MNSLNFEKEYTHVMNAVKKLHNEGVKRHPDNDWLSRDQGEHYSHAIGHIEKMVDYQEVIEKLKNDQFSYNTHKIKRVTDAVNGNLTHAILRLCMLAESRFSKKN